MKTAIHVVVELINAALFLLSAVVYGPAAILATSLASWWFLSDFYFARWSWWTWWMDRFAFMALTSLVLLAFAAGTRWHLRCIARGLAPRYAVFGETHEKVLLPLRAWCLHMGSIAAFRHGLWARYWTWRQRRLAGLCTTDEVVDGGSLAHLWWLRPAGLAAWSIAALYPMLWAALVLVPLHTNAMEHVASWASNQGPAILAVSCTGRAGRTGAPIDELLQRESAGFYRRGQCLFLANGEFGISSSAFPRVYRHLEVLCANRCSIAPGKGVDAVPLHSLACIGGKASFEWVQRDPDPLAGLGMTVKLARQDKVPLDSILIEP